MPSNVADPFDDTVPSARAERGRMWWNGISGIAIYIVAAGLAAAAILVAGWLAA